jgi:putative lipoprotein
MPAFSVVAVALAVTAGAAPVDPDPWFGGDKLAHFGVSAALALGGYEASSVVFRDERARLATGAGLALTLGAARELDNLGGSGTPSWRDMAWNALGMAAGLGAAWLLNNVVLHRPREWNAAPAQDRPSATTQAAAPGLLRIVF